MTAQERFKAICRFERPNDPYMWSVDSWNETFERWVREPQVARRDQPPAPAVLVARLPKSASRDGICELVGRPAGAGGLGGHAFDAISLSGAPELRSPPDLCGDSGCGDVIACLLGRSPWTTKAVRKSHCFDSES
jgi:hypothetical protein